MAIAGESTIACQTHTVSVVVRGIANYKKECFPAREFLEDSYEVNAESEVSTYESYRLYRIWCQETGHKALASNSFAKEIKKMFPEIIPDKHIKRFNGTDGPGYKGIAMKEPMTEENIQETEKKFYAYFPKSKFW